MALTKPTDPVLFATTGTKTPLDTTTVAEGWVPKQNPPSQYFNYMQNKYGEWFGWVNERFFDGTTSDDLRIESPGAVGELELVGSGPASLKMANGFATLSNPLKYQAAADQRIYQNIFAGISDTSASTFARPTPIFGFAPYEAHIQLEAVGANNYFLPLSIPHACEIKSIEVKIRERNSAIPTNISLTALVHTDSGDPNAIDAYDSRDFDSPIVGVAGSVKTHIWLAAPPGDPNILITESTSCTLRIVAGLLVPGIDLISVVVVIDQAVTQDITYMR